MLIHLQETFQPTNELGLTTRVFLFHIFFFESSSKKGVKKERYRARLPRLRIPHYGDP